LFLSLSPLTLLPSPYAYLLAQIRLLTPYYQSPQHTPTHPNTPLEHLESLKGERITACLVGNIDVQGTLRGFDSFSNLLLDDVVEITYEPSGVKTTKIDKIFLISMRITMIVKGDAPQYEEVKN
jgi:small nuclear ribonucleoprotein (snRNP)-like protein